MIGYHSFPAIVDAYFRSIGRFDVKKVFEFMKHSAMKEALILLNNFSIIQNK
jgi:hypothetical protein